jgi:hypothetical protein
MRIYEIDLHFIFAGTCGSRDGERMEALFSGGRKKLKRTSILGYQIPLLKSLEVKVLRE